MAKTHRCNVSTGIHDGLTFGMGELDHNGFWEHPCYECARKWEKAHPECSPCWPFAYDGPYDGPDMMNSTTVRHCLPHGDLHRRIDVRGKS